MTATAATTQATTIGARPIRRGPRRVLGGEAAFAAIYEPVLEVGIRQYMTKEIRETATRPSRS